jgi:hypothetical protein
MEKLGLWENAVSSGRLLVSAIVSITIGAFAPTQGIRPFEAFALALVVFAVSLFVWGRLRPLQRFSVADGKGLSPPPIIAGMGLAAEADVDYAAKVTRDFAFTTPGRGRQEIEVGFPAEFLRFYAPVQIPMLTVKDLPKALDTSGGKLNISIEGSRILLNDNGTQIKVEFLAYSGIVYHADDATSAAKASAFAKERIDELTDNLSANAKELSLVKQSLKEAMAELAGYQAEKHKDEQEKIRTADLLTNAPQILIHYRNEGIQETLLITNDGLTTASNIKIGRLEWAEKRAITLLSGVAPLLPKNQDVKQMLFESAPHTSSPLDDFLRKKLPGVDSTVSVECVGSGHGFARTFHLDSCADGSVVWNPDPVRLLH